MGRFKASILVASIGVPLYTLGFISMSRQITNEAVAIVFGAMGCVGALGGLMIHVLFCIYPILYKKLSKHTSFEIIVES